MRPNPSMDPATFTADTRTQFDAFLESRIGPAIAALGDAAMPNPPEIKEFPVHNITAP